MTKLSDEWFVTNGMVAVGPLHFDRVAEQLAQGRLLPSAFIRHASWRVWQRLDQIESMTDAARSEAIHRLAGICATAEERASDPLSVPPPPLGADDELSEPIASSHAPLSSIRAAAVNPVSVLAKATDFDSALQLTLSTAVAAANADAGLVHCVRQDLGVVVTSCALGNRAELFLGDRLADDDPSVIAARSGQTVIGEPQLGQAGRHIAGRLARSLGSVRGIAMIPALVFGRMVAMLEVGRAETPFRAREIARAEDVVEALVARMVVNGWVE